MSNVVPVVAVAVTGAVGIVSVVGAGIFGWRDRKAAGELAREERAAARELAWEERKQQRLADAYIEVLTFASRLGIWAQQIPSTADPAPGEADRHTVWALVDGFASLRVRDLFSSWQRAVIFLEQADREIRSGAQSGVDPELYRAEAANRKALVDQVARELGHRD